MFKFFKRKLKKRWLRHYKKSSWPVIVDVSLIFLVFVLLIMFLGFYFYKPNIFTPKTEPKSEVIYEIDIHNLPLKIEGEWEKKTIKHESGKNKLNLILKNDAEQEIKNISLSIEGNDAKYLKNKENTIIEKINSQESSGKSIDLNFLNINKDIRSLDLIINFEYYIAGQKIKDKINLKPIFLESYVTASAKAVYTSTDGDKLGIGPLPPVLGLPTNYWLFFEVNSIGEAHDFILKIQLPKNVNFYENYSLLSGKLNYDEENKNIFWHMDNLESKDNSYQLSLEIQLVPGEDQIGTVPLLARNISYKAVDKLSGEEINGTLSNLDANLTSDKFNFGLGKVKAEF